MSAKITRLDAKNEDKRVWYVAELKLCALQTVTDAEAKMVDKFRDNMVLEDQMEMSTRHMDVARLQALLPALSAMTYTEIKAWLDRRRTWVAQAASQTIWMSYHGSKFGIPKVIQEEFAISIANLPSAEPMKFEVPIPDPIAHKVATRHYNEGHMPTFAMTITPVEKSFFTKWMEYLAALRGKKKPELTVVGQAPAKLESNEDPAEQNPISGNVLFFDQWQKPSDK